MLEVAWSKALVVPLGNSSDATALVLAGFMLGIAVGSMLGARLARNAARALYLYALLEVLLAAFALFVPAILARVPGLAVPATLGDWPWMAFALRFTAAIGLIVFPCLVMGSTLPLLLSTPRSSESSLGSVGWLYGANTLGATVGAAVTGFYGVAAWGIAGCSRRAALCSLTAALLGLLARRLEGRSRRGALDAKDAAALDPRSASSTRSPEPGASSTRSPEPGASSTRSPAAATRATTKTSPCAIDPDAAHVRDDVTPERDGGVKERRSALVATFISGFVLLASEVVWARILTFVFGHDTYAFATLLGVVLLGLATGGLIFPAFTRYAPRKVTGWASAGVAVALLGSFYAASWLSIRYGRDPFALGDRFVGSAALSLEMMREFAFTPILALLTCVASGLAYPASIAMWAGCGGTPSRATGWIGLANGAGATVGATLASLGLVAWLGIQGVLTLLALVSAAAAAWLVSCDPRSSATSNCPPKASGPLRRVALGLVPVSIILLCALAAPRDLPRRMLLSVVGPRHQSLLYYEEARTATVSVIENGIHGERQLLVNAVNEVTTRLVHDQSFKLLGQLGPLLHPNPKQAVMICLGAGLAAGSALSHPLDRLEVVDLLRSVRHGARYFSEENNHVLDDPRLVLRVNDGRQHLLLTRNRYDLAIVDSTHPKSVDSWILYTREFFQLLHERLTADGIVVQWLPLHGLSEREFRAVVATFQSVFPQMTLWASVGYETYGQVGYAKLVGQRSASALEIDVPRLRTRLALPAVRHDLERYGMGRVPEVLDQFVAGPERIRDWVREIPTLSDDRPFLAYITDMSRGPAMTPNRLLAVREPIRPYLRDPESIEPDLLAEIERAFDAQGFVISGQLTRALGHYPTGEKIRRYVEQTKTSRPYYAALAARYGDDPERLFETGTQLGALGHGDVGRAVFDRALQLRPESLRLGLNSALLALGAGDAPRAAAMLSSLLLEYPRVALLQQNLGAALLAQNEPGAAKRAFSAALSLEPEALGARIGLADAAIAANDLAAARARLTAVLAIEPRHQAALSRLARVNAAMGDRASASREFAAAASLDPYREDLAIEWGKHVAIDRPDQALLIVDRIDRLHPESAEAAMLRGEILAKLEHWQSATSAFVIALERDPSHFLAAFGLGQALAHLGRINEARSALCLADKLGAPRPRVVAQLQLLGEKIEECPRESAIH